MPFGNGATFAGHSVLRLLGRGELGEVYLAQHPRLPHWNALKVLSATLTEDAEFRDRFMRGSCVATGALLDDADHAKLSAAGGQKPVVLDFRNGAWHSRPETMLFACLGPDGGPAKQTTTQVIWLQHADGALRGTMTVTVESNECSQQGATIEIPAVAARVAEVPPGVEVPSPPSTTPPAPAPTRPPPRIPAARRGSAETQRQVLERESLTGELD